MTRPRTRHAATNILWGLLCVAIMQFELARRLSIQPASARHLLMSVDVKLIEPLIERALVEEIRSGADLRPSSRN